jgi:hypothetical protein
MAFVLVVCCLGCGEDRLPTAAPSPVAYQLMGWVNDTAARPLADATVEIVDGFRAGEFVTTDGRGQFRLPGTFTGAVSIRASKSGYAPLTKRLEASHSGAHSVSFSLVVDGPTADIAGHYVVTFAADAGCDIPDVAKVRSYSIAINRTSSVLPHNYVGVLSGATFFPSTQNDRMYFAVAGDVARFFVDPYEDGVIIAEEVAPSTYVSIWGVGDLRVGATGLSGSMSGEMAYCTSPARANYSCLVPESKCQSTSHRVALVRK